jgi:hypothetical protein
MRKENWLPVFWVVMLFILMSIAFFQVTHADFAPIITNGVIYAPYEGLVGDSVTDETVKFKAMLAKAYPGWTIILEPGKVYRLTDSCTVPVFVQFEGSGAKIYFEAEDQEGGFFLSTGSSIRNGTIEVDTVESFNALTHGGMGTCITVGNYMTGIGSQNVTVDHVVLSANRAGGNIVFVTGSSANVVLTNYRLIPGAKTGCGIQTHWGGASTPTIRTYHPHNTVYQNGIIDSLPDSSVAFSFSGAYLGTIMNADVAYCGTLIRLGPGDYGYMYADSSVYDSTDFAGLFLFQNIISHADSLGIVSSGACNSVAEKFAIPFLAINVQTYGRDTTKTGQAGFRFDDYSGNAKLIGCRTVRHYNGATFGAYAHDIYFDHCNFYRAGSYGAYLDYGAGKPDNINFTECNFIGNYNGIYLGDAKRVSVQRCQFEGSYYGVFMDHPSSDLTAVLMNNYVKTAINHAYSAFLRIDTLNAELTKPVIFFGNKTASNDIEVVSTISEIGLPDIPTIDTMQVNFLRLNGTGVTGVGTGATQISAGNHDHSQYLTNSKLSDSSITLLNATGWRMFFSNATTTAIQELAFGAAATFLKSGGASADPSWALLADADIPNTITIDKADSADKVTTEGLCDKVGVMVTGNTETGISVTYKDEDNTIDFEVTGLGVWTKIIGTTCDTLWWALGTDTLYLQLCPDSSKMWSTNPFSLGNDGIFIVDSLKADSIYTEHLVAGTQLRTPISASPTVSFEGCLAWDSDDDKLIGHDGATAFTLQGKTKSIAFSFKNIEAADDFPFWRIPRGITLTKISAKCKDGTNVVGQLQEYDGYGLNPVNTMTTDLTVTTTQNESTSFSNAVLDAGDWLGWLTTSVSGTVTIFSLTVEYYEQ